MKKLFILFVLGFTTYLVSAQESADATAIQDSTPPKPKYWKFTGMASLNFSELMQWNWAAGGNNNGSGVIAANLKLAYKKDAISWETTFETDYGWMWTPSTKFIWRKCNDHFVFNTKFGWEFHKTWYLTVMGGFRSHYHDGFEYKLNKDTKEEEKFYAFNFLSPSYTDISVGIDWKPNDIFTVYLSPVAGRITTALDSNLRAKYGVKPDESFKCELGATFKAGVNYSPEKLKNLKIISTITLFTPYTKKFGNIDVDWDFAISYQFLKVLNVTLSTSLKYYDAVNIEWKDKHGDMHNSPRVQFREILGLGIGYSF